MSHNRPLRSLKYFLPLFIVAAIKKKKSAGEGGGSEKHSVEWAGDRGPGGEGRGTQAGLSPSPHARPPVKFQIRLQTRQTASATEQPPPKDSRLGGTGDYLGILQDSSLVAAGEKEDRGGESVWEEQRDIPTRGGLPSRGLRAP